MGLKTLLRLVAIEILRYKKINLFLALNFALGLTGFFLLLILQQSLSQQTSEKARTILGGDISISARHSFSDADRTAWEQLIPFTKKSQFFSLFAMVRVGEESKLVNVAVFDDEYPLYGELKLSGIKLNSSKPFIWVDPEVVQLLDLHANDSVALGDAEFNFAGQINDDPSRLFRAGAFAPRVLIHKKYLADSKLIQQGSTYSEYWMYKVDSEVDIEPIKNKVEKAVTDPVVQIETTEDSARDGNKTLKYFTDYLGLVALVALGLCFLCGSYLLQWIFQTKRKNVAIFKTLGLNDQRIIFIYLMQTVFIALFACAIAIGLVSTVLPFIQTLLVQKFNLPVSLAVNLKSIAVISALGVAGPLLMTVPQILQIFELHPTQLFQASVEVSKKSKLYYFWVLLSIFAFLGLSIWQSHSYKIGSGFVVGILVLIAIFYFFNRVIMTILERFSQSRTWLLQYSIKGLTRRSAATRLVFITMSLSTLVLSLLPHIKASILHEIRPAEKSQIPNLFFFDIQPEQITPLQKIAKDLTGHELNLNPMVRARILKINELSYERTIQNTTFQTREDEADARFRNRGINLTYRAYLQPSEKITDGTFIPEFIKTDLNKLPGFSVEKNYAERMGFKLNDSVTFDVQGSEIKAKVTSFREVRWTSFQPNFFITFPAGVLEQAPQTFLTSVSEITPATAKKFQSQVARELKNVSIVNVTQAVQNSLKYIDQMSLGLQIMAWLAVAVGLFVFIILLNTQVKERLSEMNLMQVLGCSLKEIQSALFIQFFILVSLSVFFGILFGIVASAIVMHFIFNLTSVFDFQYMVLLVAGLIPIAALSIFWGLRPLKSLNPMDLIRQTT